MADHPLERPAVHGPTSPLQGGDAEGRPSSPHRVPMRFLKPVMFLFVAVVIGLTYRVLGGDPDVAVLVSAPAGLGAVAAVELADSLSPS